MDCLMISFKIFPGIEVMLAGLQFPWFFSLLNIATMLALFWSFRTSFIFQEFLQIVADGPPPILKDQTSVVFVLPRCCYTLPFYSDSFNCINFVVLMLSFFYEVWTKKSIKHSCFNSVSCWLLWNPNLYLFASWDSCEPNPWDPLPSLTLISSFTTRFLLTACVCVREVMKVNLFFRWHPLVC